MRLKEEVCDLHGQDAEAASPHAECLLTTWYMGADAAKAGCSIPDQRNYMNCMSTMPCFWIKDALPFDGQKHCVALCAGGNFSEASREARAYCAENSWGDLTSDQARADQARYGGMTPSRAKELCEMHGHHASLALNYAKCVEATWSMGDAAIATCEEENQEGGSLHSGGRPRSGHVGCRRHRPRLTC